MLGQDTMLVCANGHVITDRLSLHSRLDQGFCQRCGAQAFSKCPSCGRAIPGAVLSPGQMLTQFVGIPPYIETLRPKFCASCGKAFPWTERKKDDTARSRAHDEPVVRGEPATPTPPSSFEYDVAITYAAEDVAVAGEIARRLTDLGVRVFFDKFSQASLWGKNLAERFRSAYGNKTRYVLVLVSRHYVVKDWTGFEFTIARGEAAKRPEEFILPVRLDDTPMLGLRQEVAYVDYQKEGSSRIVDLVREKLRLGHSHG